MQRDRGPLERDYMETAVTQDRRKLTRYVSPVCVTVSYRDKRQETEKPPILGCPPNITSCHPHTGSLRWKLAFPFYWKRSNRVHSGLLVESHGKSVEIHPWV